MLYILVIVHYSQSKIVYCRSKADEREENSKGNVGNNRLLS